MWRTSGNSDRVLENAKSLQARLRVGSFVLLRVQRYASQDGLSDVSVSRTTHHMQ